MKAWKKGAVIGAVWGLISWYFAIKGDVRMTPTVFKSPITGILVFPVYIVWLVFLGIGNLLALTQGPNSGLIWELLTGTAMVILFLGIIPVLPILIGALLGYGIAKIYLKAKK